MLTREGLAKIEERMVDDLIAHTPAATDAHRYGLRTTSGTTSGTPLMTVTQYPPQIFKRFDGSARVVFCSGSMGLRLTRALQLRRHAGVHSILSVDARDLSSALSPLLSEFEPDMIEGVPSFVVRVAEYMDANTAKGVRKLLLFGERLVATVESFLRGTFSNAEIRTLYLSTEMAYVGRSCPHLPSLNFYHPAPDVEIKLVNVDDEGVGDLLVSKWLSDKEYAEDYLIGDTGRIQEGTCECGATLSLEHLGRGGYDYIKLAGALVRREEFERVVQRFAQHIDDYRVMAGERVVDGKLKGAIVLRIFSRQGPGTPALAAQIAGDFSSMVYLSPTQTLADLVAKDLFVPLVVEFSSEPFPQKNKEVKLQHLVS